MSGNQLESKKSRRDLGMVISTKLTWRSNCDNRFTKAWRVYYIPETKDLYHSNKKTNLSAFSGYALVVSYASRVLYANKIELKHLEKVLQKDTN